MEEAGSATRLGAIVRRRRLELGMTQEHLALSAGVSPKSIVTLEMGRTSGRREVPKAIEEASEASSHIDRRTNVPPAVGHEQAPPHALDRPTPHGKPWLPLCRCRGVHGAHQLGRREHMMLRYVFRELHAA